MTDSQGDGSVGRRTLLRAAGGVLGIGGLTHTARGASNTIKLSGGSRSNPLSYRFTASESVSALPGSQIIEGRTGRGAVGAWYDAYEFTGEITEFSADDGIIVQINGTEVDPGDVGTSTAAGSGGLTTPTYDRTITVDGRGYDGRITYEVDVSEAVRATATGDHADGSHASGSVWGWYDEYEFAGEVTSFSADPLAEVDVTVDGTAVDPATLGTDGTNDGGTDRTTERTITIDGVQGTTTNYEFTVSGTVEALDSGKPSGISGRTVDATVWGWMDQYAYTGEVTAISLDGPATVYVDGQQVDPATLGSDTGDGSTGDGGSDTPTEEHHVRIDGSTGTVTDYVFTVSGTLSAQSSGKADAIDGQSVAARVWGWRDDYTYTGEITEFSIDGPAAVSIDGTTVDPTTLGTDGTEGGTGSEDDGHVYQPLSDGIRTMLVNAVDRRYREVCRVQGRTVYRQTASGSQQQLASLPQSFHTPTVFLNAAGEYLVVTGSARVRGTAYLYESATALARNDPAASYEGAFSPRTESAMPYKHARTGETGFVWGEYHLDRGTDSILVDQVRVFRASSANGYSIEPVLTLSTDGKPKNLHVHSVDHDPYSPGTMYLTVGDPTPIPQFYRSTNYGRTWQAVAGAGGDQRFRTLRVNFGPSYLYWAMDGFRRDDTCRFYRAPRSNPAVLTDLGRIGNLDEQLLSYGSTRTYDPDGILITTRVNRTVGEKRADIPVYFYSFSDGSLRVIHRFPADYGLHSRPGVRHVLAYQNQTTGTVTMQVCGVPNDDNRRMMWVAFDPRDAI